MIRARQAKVVANRDHGNSRVMNCSKVRCRKKRFLRATGLAAEGIIERWLAGQ